MSTNCLSGEGDSVPKPTHETHSFEEVVDHVPKMNGTFYGSVLLDQLESHARDGDPSLLLENSTERRRAKVPLMEDMVELFEEKGEDTATSNFISIKDGKKKS